MGVKSLEPQRLLPLWTEALQAQLDLLLSQVWREKENWLRGTCLVPPGESCACQLWGPEHRELFEKDLGVGRHDPVLALRVSCEHRFHLVSEPLPHKRFPIEAAH